MENNSEPIYRSKVVDPIITIAIPTYKRSDLLYEAILSALNQETSVRYDIVVVDNNPERNDETELMMKQFESHPLVSYYKNTSNLGMVGNFNQLFCVANGEWVSMLHDDDLLASNYVEVIRKAQECLINPDIIIPERITSSKREILGSNNGESLKYYKIVPEQFILGNIIGPPVGMCIRRNFYFKTQGFRQEMYPSFDFDFYITATHMGNMYQLKHRLCLYFVGVNESLKKDTIIGFFIDSKKISNRLSSELKFPYNVLNRLCYRWLVYDIRSWAMRFSSEDVINEAFSSIKFRPQWLLDSVSILIAKSISAFFQYRKSVNKILNDYE